MKDEFQGIDVDRLVELYYNDVPVRRLADIFEISYNRCRKCIELLGLPKRTNTYTRLNVTIDPVEIRQMIEAGLTDSQIASKLCVDIEIAEAVVEIVEMEEEIRGELNNGSEKRVHWC